MSQIKKALEERNKVYSVATKEAFALFTSKLNKAMQYFLKVDRDIQWVAVEMVPGNDNFLYITGLLEVRIGETVVHSDNSRMEVDEAYIEEHGAKTIMRLMLAVNDLEKSTPQELFQKVKNYYELSASMKQEDILRLLSSNNVKSLEEVLGKLGVSPQPVPVEAESSQDFDKSILSKEQLFQLKVYESVASKAKN